MDLTQKTTILFPPDLHERLTRLAAQSGRSLGELVCAACVAQYKIATPASRQRALEELAQLGLPVADPDQMARESVPAPRL